MYVPLRIADLLPETVKARCWTRCKSRFVEKFGTAMYCAMFSTWLRQAEQEWRYALSHSIEHCSRREPRILSYGKFLSIMMATRTTVVLGIDLLSRTSRKGTFMIHCVCSLFVAMLVFLPMVASAVVQCPAPDRSFKAFLQQFEEDIEFQRSRLVLPLVSRSGEYTMTNVLVEPRDIEKIKELDYPLMLSRQGRKIENVTESILLSTKRYAEVFHDGPPEYDLYRMLYKFRSINNSWFLEAVYDKSQ